MSKKYWPRTAVEAGHCRMLRGRAMLARKKVTLTYDIEQKGY